MKNQRASDDFVRIYVSRRANGQTVSGWEKAVLFLDGGWVGWTTITESEAKHASDGDLIRCRRTPSQRWCEWLGPNTSVADDLELQAYFATIADDEWPRMAIAIRHSQRQAVAEWRAAGVRLIAAATRDRRGPASRASKMFLKRGSGPRSLLNLLALKSQTTDGPKIETSK